MKYRKGLKKKENYWALKHKEKRLLGQKNAVYSKKA